MKTPELQQTPSGGSDHRFVRRVRTWRQSGTTPAHGKLMVHPSGKACAVDYGCKVRVFWRRDPRWQGLPAFPHQYSRKKTIPANAKHIDRHE
jgi:hypothetical protein